MSLKTYTSLMLTKIFKYFNSLPADILSFLVAQYVKLRLKYWYLETLQKHLCLSDQFCS
jgi:hypothetical protein